MTISLDSYQEMPSDNSAPTFLAGDGIATIHVRDAIASGNRVLLLPNGKILVVGHCVSNVTNFPGIDIVLVQLNRDGSADTSFGNDGVTRTAIDYNVDLGRAAALQSDGRVLVGGATSHGFALLRYNNDGSLDTSFDRDGMVVTSVNRANHNADIAIQPDGKILVAGISLGSSGYSFALLRYNPDGTLDNTFDDDGIAVTEPYAFSTGPVSLAIQPDGKILVAGSSLNRSNSDFSLLRYNNDGSLDTNFGLNGKVTTDFGNISDQSLGITLQPDGKILVAGTDLNNYALARYNSDGSLDSSFDGDGKVTTAFGSMGGVGFSITLQSDAKILVAGGSYNLIRGGYVLSIARYNSDGSLDDTFDGDGRIVEYRIDHANSIKVQPDGKILVVGVAGPNIVAARYNSNGSLDTSFFSDRTNSLNGAPVYIENDSAVVLDGDVQVSDRELFTAGNYAGASLSLTRHGGPDEQDSFSATGTLGALVQNGSLTVNGIRIGTVTANSSGYLQLTFDVSATQATVNSALQQIAYSNSSDTPPSSVLIDWTFSDGNTGAQGAGGTLTATGSTTVAIIDVNDAPTGSAIVIGITTEYETLVASNTLADPDGLGTVSYQWQKTTDGTSWVNLDGAIGDRYVLTANDRDHQIRVLAQYMDGYGNFESVASAPTDWVSGIENRIYGTSHPDSLIGTSGGDVIVALAGNDTLVGGDGNDIVDGGEGADLMIGGNGNDTYRVDSRLDQVVEAIDGGTDTVEVDIRASKLARAMQHLIKVFGGRSISPYYTTPEHVENVTLAGDNETGVIGNGENNRLIGNRTDNVLRGLGGDDTLMGGGGRDIFIGGAGHDTFVIDRVASLAATISDFTEGEDRIGMDTAMFGALFTNGSLSSGIFGIGVTVTSAAMRLYYDQRQGALYYDPDGSGTAASTQIARFMNQATLASTDFILAG